MDTQDKDMDTVNEKLKITLDELSRILAQLPTVQKNGYAWQSNGTLRRLSYAVEDARKLVK